MIGHMGRWMEVCRITESRGKEGLETLHSIAWRMHITIMYALSCVDTRTMPEKVEMATNLVKSAIFSIITPL